MYYRAVRNQLTDYMKNIEYTPQIADQNRAYMMCLFCWLATLGVAIVLTVASCTSTQDFNYLYGLITDFLSLSKTSMSTWLHGSPGFGHFLCYALLSLSLSAALSFHFSHRYKLLIAAGVAGLFGLLMEVAQTFIPSRTASLADMGVNITGIAVGLGVYLLLGGFRRVGQTGSMAQ